MIPISSIILLYSTMFYLSELKFALVFFVSQGCLPILASAISLLLTDMGLLLFLFLSLLFTWASISSNCKF